MDIFNLNKKDNANPEYHPNVIAGMEEGGVKSQLQKLNEKMDKIVLPDAKKAMKEFKLPSKIKSQLKKLAEKNKILVILLKTNKGIDPIVTDIKNGFISINGIPHNCSMDFIYLWKGKYPCIVLNEWDLNPVGTKDYYDAVKDKRVAPPIAVVLRMIKMGSELVGKDKMSFGPWFIWAGLAAIAIIYLFLKK